LTANPHLLAHDVVRTAALQHGRTAAQVLLRYLTQQAVTPLTGTTSQQHMQEDLAIFTFTLSAPECTAITDLLADLLA